MKRIIIVHQWGASPSRDWYPWLKRELESKGYEVLVPAMPNPDAPEINSWVNILGEVVGEPNRDTVLVGHSVGCQTILRYMAKLPETALIGKVVLVAPWLTLSNEVLSNQDYSVLVKSWLDIPIDWESVKKHCDSFLCFFSKDDPYVPIENARMFKEKLNAEVIIENDMGHYEDDSNIKKIPQVLEKLAPLPAGRQVISNT
ncbi:MAG: alpha/beta fold hydrolase [Patescibacteria group bacterium]